MSGLSEKYRLEYQKKTTFKYHDDSKWFKSPDNLQICNNRDRAAQTFT